MRNTIMPSIKSDAALYDLLEGIRPRPSMYLGKPSISLLQAYINGFSHAYAGLKKEKEQKTFLPLPFWFFHEFVKNYYKAYESTPGWCSIILQNNNFDDEKSLEAFYNLIDIYKNLSVVNCQVADISQSQNDYNISNKLAPKYSIGTNPRLYPVFPNTKKVFIYELSDSAGYVCAIETENELQIAQTIKRRKSEISNYFSSLFGEKLQWEKTKFKTELDKKYCLALTRL